MMQKFVGDPVFASAVHTEDIVVGDEIVRHKLASRIIHWLVALAFIGLLVTGLPIWTPAFGWLAALVGGLAVCRWLHPWLGLGFAAATTVMVIAWWRDMILEKRELGWFGPKMIDYFLYRGDDPETGKYNGGQKLFFYLVAVLALATLATGVVLWFPLAFGEGLREVSLVIHDLSFILFASAIIVHIYLGTAAEPGTFHSMIGGTVTRSWARFHHPRWYREVTETKPHAPE